MYIHHSLEEKKEIIRLHELGASMSELMKRYHVLENCFGLMKSELLYANQYKSMEHFKKDLKEYIEWYNNKRIKMRLKGMSPVQYRAQYLKNK